ncbi:MAG TPA: PLP-dependent aminotransferase family protein [Opitutaceae bacterium]|jgi:DNA-binding transcriptional MocR family regulator
MAAPLYLRLADAVEALIRRRSLRPGDRIASVRQFSREQRVSVPTALNAYVALETRGLIEARPKSGFFVRAGRLDSVPVVLRPRTPPRLSDLAHSDPLDLLHVDHADGDSVSLGSAIPGYELLPVGKLARIAAGIARRNPTRCVDYDMPPGDPSLRREIARRSLASGHSLGPEDILITCGATEAVYLALRATCRPGDTVVVESPTFFGLLRQLRELRLRALPVPVDPESGIDLDALAQAFGRNRVAACLVIPNFHNPVGCLMPDERKRELVRLASSRRVPVIEDDIYGDIPHSGPRPRTLRSFDREGGVILCSSFSKCLAPGMRVGYVAGGEHHGRILSLKRTVTLAGSTLPALAVAEYLAGGGFDRFLRLFRERCRVNTGLMRDAIAQAFPPGVRLSRPEGGFVLWCELPGNVDSMELFRQAKASGVTVAPGPFFSSDGGFRNFMRINCGMPWGPRVERAIGVLAHVTRTLASGPRRA